ncbi:MAG: FAD-dependent oxidoreductase, partial [candidate division Zixibacteria bacterium]|nr:FAD-dependent oxidoreductase [candidate division Zixibacteria bacterium]
QAALTAHRRGHRVTLLEKSRLGGQFSLAFLSPGKERMEKPFRSMVAQVERSGIEVRLGEQATLETLEAHSPDAVVIATGSCPARPDIPGLDDAITGEEILAGTREAGDRVLILGGGMVGLEVAEFLAGRGKQVAVLHRHEEVAHDMDPIGRKLVLKRIAALSVELHMMTNLVRIVDGRVFVENRGDERELGQFDTVVITGNHSFDPLSEQLQGMKFAVKVIGDAEKPGSIYQAVSSGHEVGLAV